MAVVINDFEVIAEPPAASAGIASPHAETPGAPAAPEVERVLLSLAERLARVEAH